MNSGISGNFVGEDELTEFDKEHFVNTPRIFPPSFEIVWNESTITKATTGLLNHPRLIDDESGAVGGMLGRENRSTRRKPAPVPLCLP
jgi:hypothetical protein